MWLVSGAVFCGFLGLLVTWTAPAWGDWAFLVGSAWGSSGVIPRGPFPRPWTRRGEWALVAVGCVGTSLWLLASAGLVGSRWIFLVVPAYVFVHLLVSARLSWLVILSWGAFASLSGWVTTTEVPGVFLAALPLGGLLLRGVCRRL